MQKNENESAPLVYVGSSWKNAASLDAVHVALQAQGLNTYDFRELGFWWADVSPVYQGEDPYDFLRAPESCAAFEYDRRGLDACVAGLFVLPAGISTALECGYMAGRGCPTFVYGVPRDRMDIMWKLTTCQFSPKSFDLQTVAIHVASVVRLRHG